jgi:hypothetical protein
MSNGNEWYNAEENEIYKWFYNICDKYKKAKKMTRPIETIMGQFKSQQTVYKIFCDLSNTSLIDQINKFINNYYNNLGENHKKFLKDDTKEFDTEFIDFLCRRFSLSI